MMIRRTERALRVPRIEEAREIAQMERRSRSLEREHQARSSTEACFINAFSITILTIYETY